MNGGYEYTNEWFTANIPTWQILVPKFDPRRVLEIGSYEGRSACWFIENCTAAHELEIHCVDTWEGGVEHDQNEMSSVETRFDRNIQIALGSVAHPARVIKHKKLSSAALASLQTKDKPASFDVVYIDGSHQAPDVLTDAVMAFPLLRVGGLMIFDDYIWSMEAPGKQDAYNLPKPAIDAFMNIFQRKMLVVRGAPVYQLYATKIAL